MNKGEVKELRKLIDAIEDRAEAYDTLEQPEAKKALGWASYQLLNFIESCRGKK